MDRNVFNSHQFIKKSPFRWNFMNNGIFMGHDERFISTLSLKVLDVLIGTRPLICWISSLVNLKSKTWELDSILDGVTDFGMTWIPRSNANLIKILNYHKVTWNSWYYLRNFSQENFDKNYLSRSLVIFLCKSNNNIFFQDSDFITIPFSCHWFWWISKWWVGSDSFGFQLSWSSKSQKIKVGNEPETSLAWQKSTNSSLVKYGWISIWLLTGWRETWMAS